MPWPISMSPPESNAKGHTSGQRRVFVMGSGLCSMWKKLPWRSGENKFIKLVSIDGKVMTFKRRVYVKEIVEEYPNHGIFDAGSMKRLETHALTRPLDHSSELQPGQPYHLIPLSYAASRFEELSQNNNSYPEIISTSPIDGSRVLQVKLRMRKGGVASFLNSANINFAKNFVMKETPSLATGQHSYKSGSGFSSEWKPSLDTIPEFSSLQAGN